MVYAHIFGIVIFSDQLTALSLFGSLMVALGVLLANVKKLPASARKRLTELAKGYRKISDDPDGDADESLQSDRAASYQASLQDLEAQNMLVDQSRIQSVSSLPDDEARKVLLQDGDSSAKLDN